MQNNTSTRTRTRKTILSIVASGIITAAIMSPVLTASADAPTVAAAATRISEPTPTTDEQQIIDWAEGLFDEAGLELPDVEIGFYATKEPCDGNKGTYRPQPTGAPKVRICDWHERDTLRDAWRRKTLVHELAHAWADTHLDHDHEHEFTEHRGLEAWNDRSDAWETRGTEHAAEIITWGIIDQPMRIDSRIEDTTTQELTHAYRLLTGMNPTNGPTING